MPEASVRVDMRSTGADLRAIARELHDMNDRKVRDLLRTRVEAAAKPFVPRVRASVMAIPTEMDGEQTGLRARIAACAQVASWTPSPRQVSVAVEIYPEKMPPREKGLPLYMEGVADKGRHDRWRHPVYGRSEDPWVQQPPHPYFYQAVAGYGRAAGDAVRAALEDITRQISG